MSEADADVDIAVAIRTCSEIIHTLSNALMFTCPEENIETALEQADDLIRRLKTARAMALIRES